MGSRPTRAARAAARAHERALQFRPCAFCDYDFATDEGERACSYGACAYLPEELEVHCPRCWFNFFTTEGQPDCGDPPSCDFAREEAPVRVATVLQWLEQDHRRRGAKAEAAVPRFP